MKNKIAAILLAGGLAVLSGAWVFAESDPPAQKAGASASPSAWDSVKAWFQNWKDGLADSAVEGQYQHRSLTAVASVRGEAQELDDPNKPYIKGKLDAKQAARLKKERAELGRAVDLILAGKTDEGAKKLDEFEANHPKSPLLRDVRKAREKLKQLKTADAAAPAKP